MLGTAISESSPTTSEERIALFTRLFRCREDVFPKLWENRSKGTKGYSPACQAEWVHGVCEKPKIKCSECPSRVFIPLDQTVIRGHLEGTITIGSYAIREDDTSTFLAADFDKEQWQPDVSAYRDASRKLGIEPYIERSRSGTGLMHGFFLRSRFLHDWRVSLGQYYLLMPLEKGTASASKAMIAFFPIRILSLKAVSETLLRYPYKESLASLEIVFLLMITSTRGPISGNSSPEFMLFPAQKQ